MSFLFSSNDNSFGKAIMKFLASCALLAFSFSSTLFHKVVLSFNAMGTFSGKKISECKSPFLLW